jgi:hypothetical protein
MPHAPSRPLAAFLGVLLSSAADAGCGPDPGPDVLVEREGAADVVGDAGDAGDDDSVVDAGGDGVVDAGGDGVVDAGGDGVVDAGGDDDGDAGEPPSEPDFASLPWQTGDDVGFGVAFKDAGNPRGEDVFVGYGGYGVTRDDACAWVTALYAATLRDRGVRYVYCVQGPATVGYVGLEIGNSRVARRIVTQVGPRTRFVLVAAHSSGSFVAHELLRQLHDGFDADDVTADRVVYFNLDGGAAGLSSSVVARLRRAYFVGAVDGSTQTPSPNRDTMVALGSSYGVDGAYLAHDATGSGCLPGAVWCVHMAPITTRPHDTQGSDTARDYRDFAGRAVTTAWLDAVAGEAGLLPP